MSKSAGVPIALVTATALATGAGELAGVTIAETAGAVATVKLYDNTAGSGTLVASFKLAAAASVDTDYARGRKFKNGLYCVITGTVEGSAFV